MSIRQLFNNLYSAQTENDIDRVINTHPHIFKQENWYPLGGNENNFGVIENQQSAPIAALIEKITNSIDAVLMKKCLEVGIDPKSNQAPKSMEAARTNFFPNHRDWDLARYRNRQAESIQILADGPRGKTSLIIYDDGEGQHPEEFENTFLSLLRGNKNEIHFVQGRYNMGGSGAIVFCGKKRYQLIGSKRYDNKGEFGFTLIREHPLSKAEESVKKNTWYEYLKVDGKIPSFQADQQNLGLYKKTFTTGTIIKLYSYDLPSGISDISRDLNQSINEYLFEPVLPVYTIEKEERYPKSSLRRGLYGLKRRLEQEDNKYVEESFSADFDDELFGQMKVTCYVFKTKIDDRSVQETKETIQREFFKNRMSVLFSVNGQVHGHYTSEFITKSLKLNLLKEHLLIHVDCTNMEYDFRKELFMASRDRLKSGEETRTLRRFLAEKLGARGERLWEIQKRRKDSISVESEDAKGLLKSFARNFTRNEELLKLLEQTLNLDLPPKDKQKRNTDNSTKKKQRKEEQEPFNPQRFPALFKRRHGKKDKEVVTIPLGGKKTIFFDTDVENNYFHRIDDPGELKIAILNFKTNETEGGDAPGKVDRIDDVFNVGKSSPQNGTIKIHLNPKKEVSVGDEAKIKVSLEDPTGEFEEIFWVKVSEPKAPSEPSPKPKEKEIPTLGLPDLIFAYREERPERNGELTWEQVEKATSEEMTHATVMYPMVNGEKLEKVYINMDSTVLKNFRSKTGNPSQEQLNIADKRYIASVYSHVLFLYSITKAHKYEVVQEENNGIDSDSVELGTYLKDLFDSYYAEFLLNFGFDDIMQLLEE